MMSSNPLWSTALLVALLAGCAAGETSSPDEPDTTMPPVDTMQLDDTTPGDGDADDTALDGSDPDAGDSVSDDTAPDVAPVCTPTEATCVDETTLSTCRADGSGFDETVCPTGQTCTDGACALPPMICTPSAASCSDFETRVVCSADGRTETPESCAPGRCLDGACSMGAATGAPCTAAADCAGGSCQCEGGACVGTPLEGGYCTTSQCDVHGCAPDEVCVDFGLGARQQPADCIEDCAAGCARTGFACRELPVAGADGVVTGWSQGCYQADYPRAVGEVCTADEDCIGGQCLTTSPSGGAITDGYCVAPCEDQTGCPTDSACVKVAGYHGDQGFCALRCVSDGGAPMCPPQRPLSVGVGCRLMARAEGGGTEQVCFEN